MREVTYAQLILFGAASGINVGRVSAPKAATKRLPKAKTGAEYLRQLQEQGIGDG